jgi:hypothetical protein
MNYTTYSEIIKKIDMESPKKRGRKKLDENEKVILVSVYLKKAEKQAIIEKYKSVTNAVREEVLPKLEKVANI